MLFTKKVDGRQIFKKALDGYFMKKGRIETGEGNYPMITVGAIFHVLLVLIKTVHVLSI